MTQKLWSVTTINKLGLGTSDAILGWAVKTTAEYAIEHLDMLKAVADKDRNAALKLVKDARWSVSSKAMLRGTEIHNAAEQLAYGEQPDVTPEVLPYVQQYARYLEEHQPAIEMAEAPVYNPSFHYAGTLDAIIGLGGKRYVLDMKTTPKHPDGRDGARPPYPEIALQLVAYRRSELVGLGPAVMTQERSRRYYLLEDAAATAPMPETDGALALIVSPYDYRLIPVRTDDEVWNAFLYVREVARWQLDTSQKVLGPMVAPSKEVAA